MSVAYAFEADPVAPGCPTCVEANARVEGTVGPGATIGYGATIAAGATIGPGAVIGYGAVVGSGAIIGELAYVGLGAYVGDGASVGDEAYVGEHAVVGDDAIVRVGAAVAAYSYARRAHVVTAAAADDIRRRDEEDEADEDAMPRALRPLVPVVFALDSKILAALELVEAAGTRGLGMGAWHTCKTTHCRAGWAILMAGPEGRALEEVVGSATAGGLIYRASTGRVPNFYASDEEALEDLRRWAAVCPLYGVMEP